MRSTGELTSSGIERTRTSRRVPPFGRPTAFDRWQVGERMSTPSLLPRGAREGSADRWQGDGDGDPRAPTSRCRIGHG